MFLKRRRLNWISRAVLFLIGLCLIAGGVRALADGEPGYKNYWGGHVDAVTVIVIGVFWEIGIVFFWKKLDPESKEKPRRPKTRKGRRAARKEAEKIKEFDDAVARNNWRKW